MLALLAALATSLVLSGLAIPVLRKSQFMDVPNHRSSHTRPVPRGGGIAVVLAILLVSSLFAEWGTELAVLLAVTVALGAVGLVDDLRSLPSSLRLLAQLVAAVCVAVVLLASGTVTWWWLPVLVVAITGYVNAYNFMDGVNGISALTAVVIGGWWAWAGLDQGNDLLHVLGLVLCGAAIGFLPWNAPRAKVFLGDVGSYGIGVFIVGLSALALTSGLPWHWTLAPLVVYGADTGWVLVKRKRAGCSLTEAHREHVYQRLVDGGWKHLTSAALCAGAAALICAVVGLAGHHVAWWSLLSALVLVLLYLNAPRTLPTAEDVR